MKLPFSKFVFLILSIVFFPSFIFAKEVHSEYVIEVGKIDVGKLFWSITVEKNEYEIFIKLEDKGVFSGLFSFNGTYNTEGKIINKGLVPSSYKQKWATKNKRRDIALYFIDGRVSKLNLFPKEMLPPKIEYLEMGGVIDPLSSFLNILKNHNSSNTIDGRRIYKMMVVQESLQNNIILKKINIENYLNIWADHNNNDLGSIQFEQINDGNEFSLPRKIKIKHKGFVFNINKI